ncbi:sugar ABC transporter ATP-binding protein [Subtercola endophyticus]|uniref:sugar ABC transporter ATP-binding protein n=1 Tax=Subtercola endophyticus TaxID=2895559 RepID=UPI001E2F66C0|nr:sugar ABC transporter ATP-binding protein [Subtercola endophyticus]UFS58819.1 sugar ABC transporter ATP-binding protein [Subtercola endophyticus]
MELEAESIDGRVDAAASPPRLKMSGISKRYGAVRAIREADITVRPGTVHALVGENGAGKSTLIKILSGAEAPDTGSIEIDGVAQAIATTSDAMALGIATVYQEPQLFAELSVAENIFLGREIRKGGRVDWRAQYERVAELLALIGLPARFATELVGDLSIAEQQQVSIAKALANEARILILDEPSAILTDAEIELLFLVVRTLVSRGVSVIYISHRLDELMKIADEVTVMRDGRTVSTHPIEDLSVRQIAELMVGGILNDERAERETAPGDVRLKLTDLALGRRFNGVNVSVRTAEIVALYGLVGSGVADIANTIFGMARATGGSIELDGVAIAPSSPRAAQKLGIAYLPANRKKEGMFSFQSIAFNISAGHLRLLSTLGIWVDTGREKKVASEMITRLAIKTPNQRQAVGALSGGNAQKVILARQLVERPRLLILAEPTQGVDIGAKEEIHRLIVELAEAGTAVLVVTSDLPEALRVADRLIVVRGGKTTVEFDNSATQVDVLAAAAGSATEELRN